MEKKNMEINAITNNMENTWLPGWGNIWFSLVVSNL